MEKQESMESLDAALEAQKQEKAMKTEATSEWKGALTMLTSRDRTEKPEGVLWSDHIRSLVTSELEFMPSALEDANMEYVDMMVHVTGHISKLEKEAKKLTGSIQRRQDKKERIKKQLQKKDSKYAKLVEEVLTNPEAVKEKVEEARRGLTWNFFVYTFGIARTVLLHTCWDVQHTATEKILT